MATGWHLANSLIKTLTQRQRDQADGLMAQLQATERALSSDRAAGDAMAQGHVDYLLDLAHSSAGAFLTAITGEQIIGFCVVIITKEDECDLHLQDSFKQAGKGTDLIVHPNHRKRSIGRALISALPSAPRAPTKAKNPCSKFPSKKCLRGHGVSAA